MVFDLLDWAFATVCICQGIITTKGQINWMKHKAFLEGVDKFSEAMFSSPSLQAELSQRLRKRRKTSFDRLQHQATAKVIELDNFLGFEVDIRYEDFKDKLGSIELSHLLRQGTPAQVPPTETPQHPCQQCLNLTRYF